MSVTGPRSEPPVMYSLSLSFSLSRSLLLLLACAGSVRSAAALRDSLLCLPTDIHSLLSQPPPPPP